jgi:ABC-type antimicrobial peptide transport system permease subunit
VAVIDEQTASFLFPDRTAIGAYLPAVGTAPARQIIGVARPVVTDGPDTGAGAQVYWPMATVSSRAPFVLIRLSPEAGNVLPAIQAALQQVLPPGTAAPPIRSLDDAFRLVTAGRRANATMMSAFGLVVLLIGAAGVYAVMASIVAQKQRELGVRIALGATRGRIIRGVLTGAATHLAGGLLMGLAAGWGLSGLFASMLFQVQPTDVSIYLSVSALLITTGFFAALHPARRAARVDPIVTLRAD